MCVQVKGSWKTTAAGILGAFLTLAGPVFAARLSGDTTAPPINSSNVLQALAIAAVGYLAKDGDVTGGTRQ